MDTKIMKYPRDERSISNNNLISVMDLSLQMGDKISEVRLFRLVVEGKDDKVGNDQKNEKKDAHPNPSQLLKSRLYGIERQKEGDEKEGEKVDKIAGTEEVADVENVTEDVSPSNRKNQNSQKDKRVLFDF